MPPATIHLDECGYTGDDLAQRDQPIFAVATHSLSTDESIALRTQFFSGAKAPELKHGALQNRTSHRAALLAFLDFVMSNPERFRVVFADKRFALSAKVVDFVLEPAMREDGIDVYEGRGNVALANLLFFALQAGGSPMLDNMLRRFQRMMRERSEDSLASFIAFVELRHPEPVIDEVLDFVRIGARHLTLGFLKALPPRTLDISLTTALVCMYAWRQSGLTSLNLVHDESTNMAKNLELWKAIVSPTAPPAIVGHADFEVMFPLGIESTSFRSSRNCVELQLADLLAGAVARWGRWLLNGRAESDAYAVELDKRFGEVPKPPFVWSMWASREIERAPPRAAGVGDPLAYLEGLIGTVPRG